MLTGLRVVCTCVHIFLLSIEPQIGHYFPKTLYENPKEMESVMNKNENFSLSEKASPSPGPNPTTRRDANPPAPQ